ncbi:CdaR family transcriptional regulator [Anaerobacterium chartisolvens]|uniref:CdaR family transcriptional regulator n=1 Tax=Anaerobacterium chartisolvens TaxID=1297424 RepID=A0A369B3B1_9FIRM|nr:helix-turn-helix domain-containing protein [Anaerobacterium chartisolvens]RCX16029.1 CdaR family transcriptional regulator [Anaerobacterium chartisolvens]
MQITAKMFEEHLGKHLIKAEIPESFYHTYASVQLVFPGQNSFQPGQAYVVSGDLLYSMDNIDASCLVICAGEQPIALPCPVLVCRGSINEVYAAAVDAVNRYSALERELNDGLLANKEIPYFVRICARFFKNRVQIHDSAHSYIAGEEPVFEEGGSEPSGFVPCDKPLPLSFIASLKKTNELRRLYEVKNAHLYNSKLFPSRSITLNFFDEEGFLGRLIIIENITPFSCAALDTVNFIGKYFNHLMIKRASTFNAGVYTDEYYLSELLSGRFSDRAFLTSYFSGVNWNVNEQYRVLYVRLNSQDMLNQVRDYYVKALSGILCDSKVFPYQDSVVAVIPAKSIGYNDLEKNVSLFLQKSELFAGLSEVFNDLISARDFLEQAQAAVRLGIESGRKQYLFNYHDYALEDFISGSLSEPYRKTFMHPAVQAIMEYDSNNGTSYFDTLEVYLNNERNQATTARELHIHLNTLKYRLSRLQKIMGINLDSPSERLRLMLSLRLKELIKK